MTGELLAAFGASLVAIVTAAGAFVVAWIRRRSELLEHVDRTSAEAVIATRCETLEHDRAVMLARLEELERGIADFRRLAQDTGGFQAARGEPGGR